MGNLKRVAGLLVWVPFSVKYNKLLLYNYNTRARSKNADQFRSSSTVGTIPVPYR
jgi:hypothetical protein